MDAKFRAKLCGRPHRAISLTQQAARKSRVGLVCLEMRPAGGAVGSRYWMRAWRAIGNSTEAKMGAEVSRNPKFVEFCFHSLNEHLDARLLTEYSDAAASQIPKRASIEL